MGYREAGVTCLSGHPRCSRPPRAGDFAQRNRGAENLDVAIVDLVLTFRLTDLIETSERVKINAVPCNTPISTGGSTAESSWVRSGEVCCTANRHSRIAIRTAFWGLCLLPFGRFAPFCYRAPCPRRHRRIHHKHLKSTKQGCGINSRLDKWRWSRLEDRSARGFCSNRAPPWKPLVLPLSSAFLRLRSLTGLWQWLSANSPAHTPQQDRSASTAICTSTLFSDSLLVPDIGSASCWPSELR